MPQRAAPTAVGRAKDAELLMLRHEHAVPCRIDGDVWLPVERITQGERVGTAFRATRYHRAEQPPSPEPEADSNRAAGEMWTRAGFALVVTDARGCTHLGKFARRHSRGYSTPRADTREQSDVPDAHLRENLAAEVITLDDQALHDQALRDLDHVSA